jgi:hypothetical protein
MITAHWIKLGFFSHSNEFRKIIQEYETGLNTFMTAKRNFTPKVSSILIYTYTNAHFDNNNVALNVTTTTRVCRKHVVTREL